MKKRKGWKLTHVKYGDEYYLDDVQFKLVKKRTLKNYNIQRVIIYFN